MADDESTPADLSLTDVTRLLGISKATASRRYRAHSRWSVQRRRRVKVVPLGVVLALAIRHRGDGETIPELAEIKAQLAILRPQTVRNTRDLARVLRHLGLRT